MTETTALLRALHCDMAATNGLLSALLYKKGRCSTRRGRLVRRTLRLFHGRCKNLACITAWPTSWMRKTGGDAHGN